MVGGEFKFTLKLIGDLKKIVDEEVENGKAAVTAAVRLAATGLKADLGADVRAAGLGAGLSRAWQTRNFPKTGVSLGAAAVVESKAPKIIRAFEDGVTIRSSKGLFLAIPTAAAPKKGVGGKRISPANFPEHRFGRLRFVFRRGRPSLLVVDGLVARRGKRGGFRAATVRKASKTRGAFVSLKDTATVVMFVLVKQVALRKRLNIAAIGARWQDRVPGLVIEQWRTRDLRATPSSAGR